jgi:hypothetical protein|uniref:Radial spoke protein 3 n=1 Tax=Eutreptiella gymnastica TaxID=73025 RepID=A0A7S4GDR1_9EUGL|mmetsp:Transcript_60811/g.100528  ORF Transcript_60811/g.100528 Transcript_60811/m.100528 type:complete len:335 (-) Transcript_60811:291-1295(-)
MQDTQKRGGYTFNQQPAAIAPSRKKAKYRDPHETFSGSGPLSTNLMWDKRVVRGNTYAAQVLPLSAQTELAYAEKEAQKQRKKIAAERKRLEEESRKRPSTPEAVDGRKHIEIQTETYLEELTDKVEENTVDTQTDPMMDRPPTPLFVPFKTGRDMETQIEDGDLFDFNFEVEPILEVMVGKTLEQAMLEVMQEEELEAMRQHQLQYEQRRKEELMETQRLEAAEQRRYDEKERRKKQEVERLRKEKETREKLASRLYATQFLRNLENQVFGRLEDEGWFYDGVEREVETEFYPWLMSKVDAELDNRRKARSLVDELIRIAANKARKEPKDNLH